jgi:hypothetical protein
MLVEALENVKFKDYQRENKFKLMAEFVDDHLPYSLGFGIYTLVKCFQDNDLEYEIAKDKKIDLEVKDDALFEFTIDDWRDFYSYNVVVHNLNAETALYAQGAFRQIMVQAMSTKTIGNDDIAYLKTLEPLIMKMANSKPERVPLLIEPMDVLAIKKAEELQTKYQEYKKTINTDAEPKEQAVLFSGITIK